MRILVADDSSTIRRILQDMLRGLGHNAEGVADGEEAWRRFQDDFAPIVISDWIMPKVDGLELCRRIRARETDRYCYVILLTSLEGKNNYLQGMDAGADDFLTKPADMEQLAARLRVAQRILGMHSHIRQLEGLLPICTYCKNIRDENNSWMSIENFIATRTEAQLSHGICPRCFQNMVKPQLEALAAQAR